jgi:hypothetical protein
MSNIRQRATTPGVDGARQVHHELSYGLGRNVEGRSVYTSVRCLKFPARPV